jgi:hypothetical protein
MEVAALVGVVEEIAEVVVGEEEGLIGGALDRVLTSRLEDETVVVLPEADIAQTVRVDQRTDRAEDVLVVGRGETGEEVHGVHIFQG